VPLGRDPLLDRASPRDVIRKFPPRRLRASDFSGSRSRRPLRPNNAARRAFPFSNLVILKAEESLPVMFISSPNPPPPSRLFFCAARGGVDFKPLCFPSFALSISCSYETSVPLFSPTFPAQPLSSTPISLFHMMKRSRRISGTDRCSLPVRTEPFPSHTYVPNFFFSRRQVFGSFKQWLCNIRVGAKHVPPFSAK